MSNINLMLEKQSMNNYDLSATIHFTACGKHSPQFTTPVLHPVVSGNLFDHEKGWLYNLSAGHRSPDLQTVSIPGGWTPTRFRFKMMITFDLGRISQEMCVVYGYTEPTTDITDGTKLYITRIAGFSKSTYLHPAGESQVANRRYDILVVPPNALDERKYLCTPKRVFSHLAAESVFGMFHRNGGVETLNLTSEHRKYGVNAVSIDDLSAEMWVKTAEHAAKEAYDPNDIADSADEFFGNAGELCESVSFHHTRFYEALRHSTGYEYTGDVTYKELMSLFTQESAVTVDYDKTADAAETPNPPLGAMMLFDVFSKKAAVEASKTGNEKLHKEWTDNGEDVSESILSAKPMFSDLTWGSEEEDESDFLTGIQSNVVVLSRNLPPSPPVPNAPMSFGVDEYRVSIDLDLNGDIVGIVSINGGEEYRFVKPAYSLALGTGLSVRQVDLQDVASVVDMLIKYRHYV